MEELLAKMAGLLQDIYDEGHGGEFRPSIQEVLVRYNAAQQSVQLTGLQSPAECKHGSYGACADCAIESMPPRN